MKGGGTHVHQAREFVHIDGFPVVSVDLFECLAHTGQVGVLHGQGVEGGGIFPAHDPEEKLMENSRPNDTALHRGEKSHQKSHHRIFDLRSGLGKKEPLVFPEFSILDPTLTHTLPKTQVANGIIDTFICRSNIKSKFLYQGISPYGWAYDHRIGYHRNKWRHIGGQPSQEILKKKCQMSRRDPFSRDPFSRYFQYKP